MPSTRLADLRFVLPDPPRSVAASSAAVAEAFAEAGVEVVDDRSVADLVVEPSSLSFRNGAHVRRLLVRGGPAGPRLVVPLDARRALTWSLSRRLPRPLARAAASIASPLGRVVPHRSVVTLRSPSGKAPYVLRAAASVGAPTTDWALVLGEGDDLQRVLVLTFDGGDEPTHAVKLCRVPGCVAALDADERGLALIGSTGAPAAHAPRLLGRLDASGTAVSVETAASGRPLTTFLATGASSDVKQRAIDAVAAWALDVARATAKPPDADDAEVARLHADVVGPWGAPSSLLDGLDAVPRVLAHQDLGSWNVLHDAHGGFTVVDWESATTPALPMWDLAYFLCDALVTVDGPAAPDLKLERAIRLLRGESASSPALFRWLDRGADLHALSRATVAQLVTLCWLHHGRSHLRRHAALGDATLARPLGHLPRIAARWLEDPLLGLAWPAYVDRSA